MDVAAGIRDAGSPLNAAGAAGEDSGEGPTSQFLMWGYKVIQCSKRYRHDWSVCPFAHTGEMAARRDPKLYLPIFCYHSKQRLPCPRGEQCQYAHNLFEYWLHPARYRTELCQFGMGCTRPVCFFAHNEAQLRHTGMPGGPQPIVAPPEPIAGVSSPPGFSTGGASRNLAPDQVLLSSISEAALKMQLQDGGTGPSRAHSMGIPEHAISDVLPGLGGGGSSRSARGAAFGVNAPTSGLKSLPLPRMDWSGPQPDAAALQQAIAAQQQQLGLDGDLGGLDHASAAAALALAQAQLQGAGRPSQSSLRRSISEAAALTSSRAPPQQQQQQQLDMQAILAATSAAMAGPSVSPQPQVPSGSSAALLDQLSRHLAAMQFGGNDAAAAAAAMAMAVASGPLSADPSNSTPLPSLSAPHLLSHQRSDVAAFAAALHQQREHDQLHHQLLQARQSSPVTVPQDAPLATQQQQPPSADAPSISRPGSGGACASTTGNVSPASAPLPASMPFSRSRAASPAVGSASALEALLLVGDEGLSLDKIQEQLSDAPPRGSPGARRPNGRDTGASAPLPAVKEPAGDGSGMGREAAAQLLAQMPESAVRDLLRVLSAGQTMVQQPAV